mmetsp:Transcript_18993/g.28019  ORF Transcript_18993/g.28019 Transcript_18993/m.28019 type:complete len:132 (-) Transcript_18993:49-444(-)
MLDTRGNTAVYLQFAHARLCSILTKAEVEAKVDLEKIALENEPVVEHDAERALAFELTQFREVLDEFRKDLMPNRLCEYLYQLSGKFTDFVTNCHVLNSQERNGRLLLCVAARKVMGKAMELVGLSPLEQI